MKRTIFACDVSNVADKGNDTTAMESTKMLMTLLMLMMRMIFLGEEVMEETHLAISNSSATTRDVRSEQKKHNKNENKRKM